MPVVGVAVIQLLWALPSAHAGDDVTLHAVGAGPVVGARYELVDERGELGELIAGERMPIVGATQDGTP